MVRSVVLIAVALCVATPGLARAQNPPPSQGPVAPRLDYALTNTRIVQSPGRVIERGTVLIRDGRITAVGASVTVPAGVTQINMSGHSVYAGLIDAATTTGVPAGNRAIPSAEPAAGGGGRGAGRGGGGGGRGAGAGGVPAATAPTAAPVILPEIDAAAEAADMFAPSSEQLANFRAGGVTAVGLMFNGGLFPGRVGAAMTGGHDESKLVLRSSIGQQVSFGTRRGGYPGTGIGAVAFVKQSLLDAQYEHRVRQAFLAGTAAGRPTMDPFKSALIPAASNEMPLWFVASNERQLIRVAEIAEELGLQKWVVAGAQEGWRVLPSLKKSGGPVVVSLDWPTPSQVTGNAFIQPANALASTLQNSQQADSVTTAMLRGNARALATAGVPVVFASLGGESGATFRDRIITTVEAGMSADDALRAATIAPAELLGISTAVGTVEAGKLANLVVVQGNNLFARNTNIAHVFVEGRHYNLTGGSPQPAGRSGGPGGSANIMRTGAAALSGNGH